MKMERKRLEGVGRMIRYVHTCMIGFIEVIWIGRKGVCHHVFGMAPRCVWSHLGRTRVSPPVTTHHTTVFRNHQNNGFR